MGTQMSITRPEVPEPALTPELLKLAATKLNDFSVALLNGGKYAKQKTPKGDLYWVADPVATSAWLGDEWKYGVMPGWPQSLRNLIGPGSIATVPDYESFRKIRKTFEDHLIAEDGYKRAVPDIQEKVRHYLGIWAGKKDVKFHLEVRFLVFDVLFNVGLRLKLSSEEVQKGALLAAAWGQGAVRDIEASPEAKAKYEKGMAARQQLAAMYLAHLQDPSLPDGLAKNMKDVYGAQHDSTMSACFATTFGGLETSSSSFANLIRHLAANPAVVRKVKAEVAEVLAKHKSLATAEAQSSLTYTHACVKEALRMTYAVGSVPKYATQELTKPMGTAKLPGKCPFMAAWKAMAVLDPTLKGDKDVFKPERWLTPAGAKNYNLYQHPFGYGTRQCPGERLAVALGILLTAELCSKYTITADGNTEYSDIGAPANGLPGTIVASS